MAVLWRSGVFLLVATLCISLVLADVYLHSPRGSNNRERETSTNRNNAQRLFDSQNNGKGGYCWGPPLFFYEGSTVTVEWTNQHECGKDNPNANCELVMQYMCSPDVRDGRTTATIPETADANRTDTVTDECWYENGNRECTYNPDAWDEATMGSTRSLMAKTGHFGMHEPYSHWLECKTRNRNRGLFTADENPGPNARHTRQNPGGTRHGFECTEERDYYPYWHPSPWKDVAVLTDSPDRCAFYQQHSQNVRIKNYCTVPEHNNEVDCSGNGGEWLEWPAWGIGAPHCGETPWQRDNHLGNTANGYAPTFNWTIPYDASSNWCVFRVRYNISSMDYDGWNTYSGSNAPPKSNSPITNDPYMPFGTYGEVGGSFPGNRSAESANLSLAINSEQFCRTFQDRSHTFQIWDRPGNIPSLAHIQNVNVRGKRGNIVQVYPAVEYDFVPTRLHVYKGDYVHFHWTGCDHNPANNDGEGRQGTDRSNIVLLRGAGGNFFQTIDANDLFPTRSETYLHAHVAQNMSFCKTYQELQTEHNNQNARDNDEANCMKLNAAGRDFHGALLKIESRHIGRTFAYMSSRNNNFTNRSQKGYLLVGGNADIPRWLIAIVAVLTVGAVVLFVVPFGLLVPTIVMLMGNALAQRM